MNEKLNQRSDCFSIVLNDNGADLFKSSKFIKEKFMLAELQLVYIAVIYHDLDKDDYGYLKTKHYHVVLQLANRCRVGTIINFISELFYCNPNQVSCDKCSSIVSQTRYLIHLDDIDKKPYDLLDIESNNMDFVNKCMKYVRTITSIDDLVVIVRQFPNLIELMSVIGYENYKKYRVVISDIRRELKYSL